MCAQSTLPAVICGSGTCGTVHTDGKDLFWFSAIVVSSLRTLLYFLSGEPAIPINSQQAIEYVSLGKKKKGVKVYCLCFYLLQTLYKLFLKVFAFTYLITFTLSEPSHNPRERKSYLLWDKTHHHHHQKTQKPSPVKPDYLTENQTPHGEWCMHTWPSWVGVTDTVLSDMKCLRSYLLTLWLNQRYRI